MNKHSTPFTWKPFLAASAASLALLAGPASAQMTTPAPGEPSPHGSSTTAPPPLAPPATTAPGSTMPHSQPSQTVGEYTADAMLTAKVKTALLGDRSVSGMDVNVETVAGVVHLTGEVDSATQAGAAERIAMEVDGVKSVANDLLVKAIN